MSVANSTSRKMFKFSTLGAAAEVVGGSVLDALNSVVRSKILLLIRCGVSGEACRLADFLVAFRMSMSDREFVIFLNGGIVFFCTEASVTMSSVIVSSG